MPNPWLHIINPNCELHAGLSIRGETYHYVLVAHYPHGQSYGILFRKGSSASLKIPFHCPIHVQLGATPSLLISESIGEESPEEWIDCNENRIIPQGLNADEIINEWCVHDKTIYACTITKKAYEKTMAHLQLNAVFPASLTIPLWDLARLYSRKISGSFFIWRLYERESILSFVENGQLCGLCNFWAGKEDFSANDIQINKELRGLAQSLLKGRSCNKIIVYNEGAHPEESFIIQGMEILPPPVMANIPTDFHEAYALALHEETNCDFAETAGVLESRSLSRSRAGMLKLMGIALAVMIIGFAALLVLKGGAMAANRYMDGKMTPIRNCLQQFKEENSRLESLVSQFRQKTRFVNRKSMLTYPMSEMQIAFPEGVWTEEMAFSETGPESWNFSLIAFSNTSGLISDLLKNLSLMKGMNNIRMVYSEQTSMKSKTGERAIKFRIEGVFDKRALMPVTMGVP